MSNGPEPEANEADVHPWEEPGAVRRDCEPDRGTLLLFAGRLSHAMAVLSLCAPILAVPSWGLLIFVLVAAPRDLALMDSGCMDPAGEWKTRESRRAARTGLLTNLLCAGFWLLLVAIAVLRGRLHLW